MFRLPTQDHDNDIIIQLHNKELLTFNLISEQPNFK